MPVYRRCKVRIWIFLLSVWYVDQGIMAEMDLLWQDFWLKRAAMWMCFLREEKAL